jgi:glycosyltransferase involved in cell wall biosynthesis
VISTEKGIKNVMAVAQAIKNKQPGLTVKLKIIGWFNNKNDENEFYLLSNSLNNIEIEMIGRQNFEVFSEKLMDIDVFFDLRKIDIENTHCLPIKLFYYAAYGRPVIYSNLKAIRRVVQVEEFGYLVNPLDTNLISDYVINYISQPVMYYKHCEKARSLAETKYNWKLIEPAFINFIDQLNN